MEFHHPFYKSDFFKHSKQPSKNEPETILLHSASINTKYGPKELNVYCGSVTDFRDDIDILTTSAFIRSYAPTSRTIFESLFNHGISVQELSVSPQLDLRNFANIWISRAISDSKLKIRRIGCIEFNHHDLEKSILFTICSYFHMLDIASLNGIKMDTVALPLLGSGSQRISSGAIIVPLFNECIDFLKRNPHVKRICFIEKNPKKANLICDYMQQSYIIRNEYTRHSISEAGENKKHALAFISYASPDKNIADNLCAKLEAKGIRVWYAPRDVAGMYAEAIHKAINSCSHFIVILSQNSFQSQHVLNEIDLAFKKLPDHIQFKPLRIDQSTFPPSFEYYLTRQHWMDATAPPLEDRLNEFVEALEKNL